MNSNLNKKAVAKNYAFLAVMLGSMVRHTDPNVVDQSPPVGALGRLWPCS